MSRLLTRSQTIVFAMGSLAIIALTSLMLAGMLGAGQWLMLCLAAFLAADAVAGHFARERLDRLSNIAFFLGVALFFIAAADRLLMIMGILI